ncbi:hypothetical protein JAAARDRAFT_46558 [Jaapia argillacea MUCL 33604]|uniref:Uncharacterized protein n=1 Tax=Jaapia argillacea MUCL 33604 TaxID=933084 RepID=A0A067PYG3_9AGAM|nr:hypothetical protein JAAARDRAFT_46558 [Jaapia argillacea MUCL 33604]
MTSEPIVTTKKGDVCAYGYVCLHLWTGGRIKVKKVMFRPGHRRPKARPTERCGGSLMPDELWNLIMLGWSSRWEKGNQPTMREIAEEMELMVAKEMGALHPDKKDQDTQECLRSLMRRDHLDDSESLPVQSFSSS